MTPREAIIRTLQRVPDQYSSMTSHEKSTMICWPDGRVLFETLDVAVKWALAPLEHTP